jgi:hypothetical protein
MVRREGGLVLVLVRVPTDMDIDMVMHFQNSGSNSIAK